MRKTIYIKISFKREKKNKECAPYLGGNYNENKGRSDPRIYEILDNRKMDHQSSMINVEDGIANQIIAILIDLGAIYSYISPN